MFTSRSSPPGHSQAAPPQSIEAVRRRARHRLIGAAVLVLLGVVGFSLLFDTQPRPIPVDIPIVIPAKNASPPLAAPPVNSVGSTATPAVAPPVAAPPPVEPRVATRESLGEREEVLQPQPTVPVPAPLARDVPPQVAAPPKQPPVVPRPASKADPAAQPTDAERARALLEGRSADIKPTVKAEPTNLRIVVQVGAFADAARAREARQKLERAGLKTYTHVADTPDGQRIRVRVGPFATKAEADRAAARVKALGLPAAILTL